MKLLSSTLFRIMEHSFINEIILCLKKNNVALKFVGGLVRDHFLNVVQELENTDIDCAVNRPIADVYKILKQHGFYINKMAMNYGTLRLYDKHTSLSIEISALREDVETKGREARIKYTSSWLADAKRRDFTINAIYYDAENGFYDPLNGIEDLKKQRVIFIGNPQQRIKEDCLRILRFFRFLGYFKNPSFEEETLTIIRQNLENLNLLSKERITHELLKIIKSPFHKYSLKMLTTQKIWEAIGMKENIETDYLNFPEVFVEQDVLIFLFCEDVFLTEKLVLPKKLMKKILFFKSLNSIEEAYYYLGKKGALIFSWYQHCINGADFCALEREVIAIANKYKSPKFPINGHDLKLNLGQDGKATGVILKIVKQWWIEQRFNPDKEDCLKKAQNIKDYS